LPQWNSWMLPYLIKIADEGIEGTSSSDPNLAKGLSTLNGELVHGPVAEAHGLTYTDLQQLPK
jgi:alanine dehydrogenase